MDPKRRLLFNAAYTPELFARVMKRLESGLGPFPFRVAETPLILTHELRDQLARDGVEILKALSEPRRLAELSKAIPPRYDVPRMDELPNCVQVDFALTRAPGGGLQGKVVELQAFPSLYALMVFMADAWAEQLNGIAGLREEWTCLIDMDRDRGLDLMRRTIVGSEDPAQVALVDLEPDRQKTSPDFVATQKLLGVESVCATRLIKKGRSLFRPSNGQLIPVKRIYNRMVFDELEVKRVEIPFRWTEDLDVTWCPHPSWYWVWSKYALPFLDHPAVPKARLLSQADPLPSDLSRYVLKPLFSYAGSGVVIDVTAEDVARIPAEQRQGWILQEKIDYAPAVIAPDGTEVKAEVRLMLMRPPEEKRLTPLICLVRLSRGKMLGVDQNKGLSWVGGSVGIWPR